MAEGFVQIKHKEEPIFLHSLQRLQEPRLSESRVGPELSPCCGWNTSACICRLDLHDHGEYDAVMSPEVTSLFQAVNMQGSEVRIGQIDIRLRL